MNRKGILLVNLGTPDSPSVSDVRKYLAEFLMDERVIDINAIGRALLVKGIIVPFRGPKSAKSYQEIWGENGSPLMHYGLSLKEKLQTKMGEHYLVELAMRYQSPSIRSALCKLQAAGVHDITVVPLFPQYASATTGSVHQKVMEEIKSWQVIPSIRFINSYHEHPGMIKAYADNARDFDLQKFDHVLFSFHGLPIRQLIKADESKCHCQKANECCKQRVPENQFCYSAQCHQTAYAIAKELQLEENQFTICFQSRLGRDPWIKPYTSEVLEHLAAEGKKNILVLCPAFVADCLETIYEIALEYDEEFKEWGGESVRLVPSLNDSDAWVDALAEIAVQ